MTPERARELISVQADLGAGYNRNATKLILIEIQKDHGQTLVDTLIREFELNELFGFKPGTEFKF